MRHRIGLALFGWLLAIAVAGCDQGAGTGATPAGEAKKVEKVRISCIPDSDAKVLEERYKMIADWLGKKIGVPVEYTPVKDYAASVTGFATGQIDMVWFGGVTGVQADMKTNGEAVFVACRDIDKKFKTYFIAGKDGGLGKVADLKELAEKAAGKKFTFGSKSSTSGHVMPRHFFIVQSGKRPEEVFKTVAYSGSHDTTLLQVANGDVDLGALNYTNYEKAAPELREKAPVIYTTPEYVDYLWVARKDLGPELTGKIRDAFVNIDPNDPTEKKILDSFKAGKFIPAEKEWWSGMRKVLEAGVDVGS